MESIETLNKRLIEKYGKYLDNQPMFRVVFSEELFEKRLSNHSKEGFELLQPRITEVRKYGYIQNKYVLEGLKEIPEIYQGEIGSKLSYEPMWVFEDGNGNPVPPIWLAIEIVLESVRCSVEGNNGTKYVDPMIEENDPKIGAEVKAARLKEIQDSLFPNETDTGDALAYKEAIVVPRNYTKDNQNVN